MNIKPFIAAAVIALTAACTSETEIVDVPVNEDAADSVNLNDDGTVATDVAEGPVNHLELDSGEIRPREVSEDNPTGP